MQYFIIKRISPKEPGRLSGAVYKDKDRVKIKVLLGDALFGQLRGKVVIDFGSGEGDNAIALAKNGAPGD
jgi:hypothetical protein